METPTPEASEVTPSPVDASTQPSADPVPLIDQPIIETIAPEEDGVDNSDDITESSETITLQDLSNYTGVDESRFDLNDEGQLMYKAKVDGKDEHVPLKDALDNYQQRSHLAKENREVVELKKSIKAQQVTDREQVNAKMQMAEDVMALAYQDLQSENESENWEQLFEDDPAMFAAKKAKNKERGENLQARYAQLLKAREESQPDISVNRKEMAVKLMEVIPGWSDDAIAQKEYKEVNEYALSKGFEQTHFNTLVDHRLVELLHKSMKYDKLVSEKVSVTKAVRKSPKLAKSGTPSSEKNAAPKPMEDLFYPKMAS